MKHIAVLALGALMLGLPALTHATFAQSAAKAAQSVEIDFPARTAHVTFDPALTNAAAISNASEQAGYPAAVQG